LYEEGKLAQAAQQFTRADEIVTSMGVAELRWLTSETLVHLNALMGDFNKEAQYRAACILYAEEVAEQAPSQHASIGVFDAYHAAGISGIKFGLLDTLNIDRAKEVAQQLGKDGPVHRHACELTEGMAMVNGSHPSSSADQASEYLSELAETCERDCSETNPAMAAAAYLFLSTALAKSEDLQGAASAVKSAMSLVEYPSSDADAAIKVAALCRMCDAHLAKDEVGPANDAAADALKLAETFPSALAGGLELCLLTMARVRRAAGDFIIAEGLLRTCMANLAPKGAVTPIVWKMLVLQDATAVYAEMLEGITINNVSREAEGEQARARLAEVERKYPATARACEALRETNLEQWYIRVMLPNPPLLLQAQI